MVMMMGCNCWITSENDVNEDVVNNNGDDLRQTAQRTKLRTEASYAASSPMMMMTAMMMMMMMMLMMMMMMIVGDRPCERDCRPLPLLRHPHNLHSGDDDDGVDDYCDADRQLIRPLGHPHNLDSGEPPAI